MKSKTYYYTDELNDEFSGIKRDTIKIDKNFKYIVKNPFWNACAFVLYRLIMTPIAFLYCKIKFHHKIVNKKCMRGFKDKGFFMYGNHTQVAADGYIPSLVSFPKKSYVIVNADNLSAKGTQNFMKMVGAMPLPSSLSASKNMLDALEKRSVEHNAIVIYPEAHIWPYYTKIRPFTSASFRYPVKFNDPVFCFTNTYSRRKFSSQPKITTYVDGPFYPDLSLSPLKRQEELRNRVYATMTQRAKNSSYDVNNFVKVEDNFKPINSKISNSLEKKKEGAYD